MCNRAKIRTDFALRVNVFQPLHFHRMHTALSTCSNKCAQQQQQQEARDSTFGKALEYAQGTKNALPFRAKALSTHLHAARELLLPLLCSLRVVIIHSAKIGDAR